MFRMTASASPATLAADFRTSAAFSSIRTSRYRLAKRSSCLLWRLPRVPASRNSSSISSISTRTAPGLATLTSGFFDARLSALVRLALQGQSALEAPGGGETVI